MNTDRDEGEACLDEVIGDLAGGLGDFERALARMLCEQAVPPLLVSAVVTFWRRVELVKRKLETMSVEDERLAKKLLLEGRSVADVVATIKRQKKKPGRSTDFGRR